MRGPRLLRNINTVRLLQLLRRGGRRSRADLARELGLNRSSVTHVVNDLLAEGLVRETGPIGGGAGRPGIGLELDPDGAVFVGAVLTTRAVRGVALDLTGRVRARRERPLATAPRSDAAGTFAAVAELVAELRAASGIPAERLGGVGVALPGVVADGVLRWAHDPSLADVDVGALLEPRFDAPLFIDNDANASALAELHLARLANDGGAADEAAEGADRGGVPTESVRHLFYLYLEEGVGGGLVIDGDIFRGASGAAGEIGKMLLGPAPAPALGRDAWFGGRVDGNGLLELYREAGGDADDPERVIAAFRAGEAAAVTAVRRWGEWLARGCVTVAKVIDPEWIVIGGPLSELLPAALPTITAALTEGSGYAGVAPPRVAASTFGSDAGAMGAAALPYHAFFTLPEV